MKIEPGDRLGPYEIVAQIGSGAMGVVYDALHKERNTRVALKALSLLEPQALYYFKNEFRSLADVSHPNLVTLYELFHDEGEWFFSMEYVEGQDFLQYVRPGAEAQSAGMTVAGPDASTFLVDKSGAWPERAVGTRRLSGVCDFKRLRESFSQLASGILSLHAAGILHRDLKPLNVKITPEGRVVILDFGLAAHTKGGLDKDTQVLGSISGTVVYMSPEQAAGEKLTEATDWYAAGVMLYEAMSGQLPFEGTTLQVLMDKQRKDPPPLNFNAGIPEDLSAICMGLLERDPAKRMTGAQALTLLRIDRAGTSPRTSSGTSSGRTSGTSPSFPAASLASGEPVFVGREAQLSILKGAFAATKRGVRSIAFIHGRSGIGKSAVVQRFLSALKPRPDVVILAGRCYEQESMPFKALDNVIDSLARYLARLPRYEAAELVPRGAGALAQVFPVLRRVDAIAESPQRAHQALDQQELQRKAFRALRELLARLGDRKRLVLYIDDLQWGDVDSALLLGEVFRGPEAPVLLLIGSYRDGYEDRSPFLKAFEMEAMDSSIERHDLPLGPLTEAEAARLAAQLLGPGVSGDAADGAAHEGIEAIARESGGNPYFVQELAAGGQAGGSTLDSVLRDRVAALPEDAQRLMQIVAVSGRPLGRKDACTAAQIQGQDPKLFASLRIARLIGGSSDAVECYHDRVRETIVAHLDTGTLRNCHLQLATTLEAAAGDTESIAIHYEGGGSTDHASRYYTLAAEAAAGTLAFKHAATLYQRALELSPLEGEPRRRLLVKLADALGNAGRGLDAARTYEIAARDAHQPEVFELERKVAFWFSSSGYVDEGREAMEKMLRRVGVKAPKAAFLPLVIALQEAELFVRGLKFRARRESQLSKEQLDRIDAVWDATRSIAMIDVPMAIYLTDCNVLLSLKAGEAMRIARALTLGSVGAAAMPLIGLSRTSNLMGVLEKLANDGKTPYIEGALSFTRGFVDFCLHGNWKKSLEELLAGERIFDEKCAGVAWEMSTIRIFSLWNLMYLGKYNELRSLAAEYTHDSNERGDLYQATSIGGSIQPFGELTAGRPEQALRMMDESLALWTRRKYTVQVATAAYIRACIFLYQRDGAGAWVFMTSEWPALKRNLYLHLSGTRQWLYYARAQSALAAPSRVAASGETLRIAEKDARHLEGEGTAFTKCLAQVIRAGCAARRNDTAAAVRLLEAAASGFDDADMSMMSAAARWRLGEVVGGERGCTIMTQAEDAMQAEGVKQPSNFAAMFVNGFAARD
jgi:eukaryotic-like serine/threonine-protein kinase